MGQGCGEAGSASLEGAAGTGGGTHLAWTRRGRPGADEAWAPGWRADGAGSGQAKGTARPAWRGRGVGGRGRTRQGPELGAGGRGGQGSGARDGRTNRDGLAVARWGMKSAFGLGRLMEKSGAHSLCRASRLVHDNDGCLPCVLKHGTRQRQVKFNFFVVSMNVKFKFSVVFVWAGWWRV
jgi:hypothetical protein